MALAQTQMVVDQIKAKAPEVSIEIVTMTTTGDQYLKGRLSDLGGKGLFVKELEEGLLSGAIDFAIHSAKDMETFLPRGFKAQTVLQRGSVEDAFILPTTGAKADSFKNLPKSSVVGTASLRRGAVIKHHRPDMEIKILRGNMNTRLAKLDAGEYDAIILAKAGLERLNLSNRISQIFPVNFMVPSATQGMLACEFMQERTDVQALVDLISCPQTNLQFTLERLFLAGVDGTCHTPVGCHTIIKDGRVIFYGLCATPQGEHLWMEQDEFPIEEAASRIQEWGVAFKKWLEEHA